MGPWQRAVRQVPWTGPLAPEAQNQGAARVGSFTGYGGWLSVPVLSGAMGGCVHVPTGLHVSLRTPFVSQHGCII